MAVLCNVLLQRIVSMNASPMVGEVPRESTTCSVTYVSLDLKLPGLDGEP
jgi:hypothetical protein